MADLDFQLSKYPHHERRRQGLFDELGDYGHLHADSCLCMRDNPGECDCGMSGLQALFERMYEAGYELGKQND